MSRSVKPVGTPLQTADGEVVGTFELTREDQPAVRFSVKVPANATRDEIGQLIAARCAVIASQEPAPALSVLEQMVEANQVWNLPS